MASNYTKSKTYDITLDRDYKTIRKHINNALKEELSIFQ